MTRFTSPQRASSDASVPEVRQLDTEKLAHWDTFVEMCLGATFFHRVGWKEVIERSFGHRTYYLYAESRNKICGVLPLAHIRSWFFGNALISTPFCVYGGTLAESPVARRVLEDEAIKLATRLRVDYLELRGQEACHPKSISKDLYVTFRKKIDPDPEKNLLAIPRKQRRMVRQGMKAGLSAEIDLDVGRFYEIYATSVRNLGTPVFSRKYFEILKEVFGQNCQVLTVIRDNRAISSVLSFYFRDEVLPYYGGSIPEARQVAANDFMYWELMRRAGKQGIRLFDYGRSKRGTGSFHFKINWGFEPQPLKYEYLLVKAKTMPDVSPLNPRYGLFIDLWKHTPLTLSKLIGPMIAKNLG
jgi:FemAB-related protein (PEP-CTERM system-associated)